MRKILVMFVMAVVVAAAVFAAGCTGDGKDNAGSTGLKELNFGYQPSTHQIAYMTAMNKGWWEEVIEPYGYTTDPDKNEIQFPTGAPEMQAMLAGEIDVAYVGAAPVISALSTGLEAKIVAAVQTQGSALVLQPDIEYNSPEDLKGLTIATFPAGTIQDTILREWLAENNITVGENTDAGEVDVLPMGPGDAITAMTAKQIDGTFLPSPSPTTLVEEGNGKIVVWSGTMKPNHPCCVLLVSDRLIEENPDLVTALVKTHIKATGYNLANPDEAAHIYANYTKNTYEIASESIANWDGSWVSDPNLIVDGVMDYVSVQKELGYIDNTLTQDQIFDLSFYEKATSA
ncbi:aliphatic sulfonates family ABC transporter, periplasmic ligand-binding protein [Methanolacinia petrolearia DSM 11571]|uniref:Aliphatic sulfonates family ABC transporter, periplasmic ligand-binding protein n=1 Tax=Methanolacinia petrolearia (strain DSM 11571 / OCM 486 / SEBR 4847) TaxID=679926 RepID=E1RD49_METP4|nr:ABC transporter substrate-binding protein [Methanolacinia petrolearia]ADN37032.1 aliphatic sulfonates family ABC transporter, periplasmic ligand-binding protein [Methanolacinia petrolearia DSM 11571]